MLSPDDYDAAMERILAQFREENDRTLRLMIARAFILRSRQGAPRA